MSGAGCARTAHDLAGLAARLVRVARDLDEQTRMPARDFGGLAGDAFRRHAARSARTLSDAAAAVAPLAAALAGLGRGLDEAAALRAGVADAPSADAADRVRDRADRVEQQAQDRWRAALGRFDAAADRSPAGPPPDRDSEVSDHGQHPVPPVARGMPRPRASRRPSRPGPTEVADGEG